MSEVGLLLHWSESVKDAQDDILSKIDLELNEMAD